MYPACHLQVPKLSDGPLLVLEQVGSRLPVDIYPRERSFSTGKKSLRYLDTSKTLCFYTKKVVLL